MAPSRPVAELRLEPRSLSSACSTASPLVNGASSEGLLAWSSGSGGPSYFTYEVFSAFPGF